MLSPSPAFAPWVLMTALWVKESLDPFHRQWHWASEWLVNSFLEVRSEDFKLDVPNIAKFSASFTLRLPAGQRVSASGGPLFKMFENKTRPSRTSSHSIVWVIIRDSNSWVPPQTYWNWNSEGGSSNLCFHEISRWFWLQLRFQNCHAEAWLLKVWPQDR